MNVDMIYTYIFIHILIWQLCEQRSEKNDTVNQTLYTSITVQYNLLIYRTFNINNVKMKMTKFINDEAEN